MANREAWSFDGKLETTLFLDPEEFRGMHSGDAAGVIRSLLSGADFSDEEGKIHAVARLMVKKAEELGGR